MRDTIAILTMQKNTRADSQTEYVITGNLFVKTASQMRRAILADFEPIRGSSSFDLGGMTRVDAFFTNSQSN